MPPPGLGHAAQSGLALEPQHVGHAVEPGRLAAGPPRRPHRAAGLWSSTEREAFIDYIARHPLAGDLIPGTGGVRKVRWTTSGSGKRGGARVIYYYYDATAPLFLLSVYDKRQRTDLTPAERRAAAALAALIKAEYQSRRSRSRT